MRVSLPPPKIFITSYILYNVIMRKSLIITIAAALLLCAVLCTAGCVTSDQIVGTYVTKDSTSATYAVFEADGTGYFTGAAEEDDIFAAGGITFSWTAAEQKKTYTLILADGTTETAVLDAEHGYLTIGDVVYEKEPSALSGTSTHPVGSPEKR